MVNKILSTILGCLAIILVLLLGAIVILNNIAFFGIPITIVLCACIGILVLITISVMVTGILDVVRKRRFDEELLNEHLIEQMLSGDDPKTFRTGKTAAIKIIKKDSLSNKGAAAQKRNKKQAEWAIKQAAEEKERRKKTEASTADTPGEVDPILSSDASTAPPAVDSPAVDSPAVDSPAVVPDSQDAKDSVKPVDNTQDIPLPEPILGKPLPKTQEDAPAQESASAPAQDSTPSQEEAPIKEEPPAQEATPIQEPALAQAKAPLQKGIPLQKDTTPQPVPTVSSTQQIPTGASTEPATLDPAQRKAQAVANARKQAEAVAAARRRAAQAAARTQAFAPIDPNNLPTFNTNVISQIPEIEESQATPLVSSGAFESIWDKMQVRQSAAPDLTRGTRSGSGSRTLSQTARMPYQTGRIPTRPGMPRPIGQTGSITQPMKGRPLDKTNPGTSSLGNSVSPSSANSGKTDSWNYTPAKLPNAWKNKDESKKIPGDMSYVSTHSMPALNADGTFKNPEKAAAHEAEKNPSSSTDSNNE